MLQKLSPLDIMEQIEGSHRFLLLDFDTEDQKKAFIEEIQPFLEMFLFRRQQKHNLFGEYEVDNTKSIIRFFED